MRAQATALRCIRYLGTRTAKPVDPSRQTVQSSASNRSKLPLLPTTAFVHRRGDHPYGSREYLLVEPALTHVVSNTNLTSRPHNDDSSLQIIASLKAHRNIVFGATLSPDLMSRSSDGVHAQLPQHTLFNACSVLLHAALDDCYNDGEQPQAVSTLHGLSAYVQACATGEVPSKAWSQLVLNQSHADNTTTAGKENPATYNVQEAVRAIATGIPRPGHSVVGQGTYRDGAVGWEAMAREFVSHETSTTAFIVSEECQLYQNAGAQLVQIELLADMTPAYLKSAGGAMARFFFL